jgi:hypothetical protein
MNALRRAPRVHGNTVSSVAAAATIPLMKRVFFFMALILDLLCFRACCPCLKLNMTLQSGRFLAHCRIFRKFGTVMSLIYDKPAAIAQNPIFRVMKAICGQYSLKRLYCFQTI